MSQYETVGYSRDAEEVVIIATSEAGRFNHNFVGTEHLLLGIAKLGRGVAVSVIRQYGVTLEELRIKVEVRVGTGPDQKNIHTIPLTPRTRKVLELARKEVRFLHHDQVDTEHLLLAILNEGGGIAASILTKDFNITLDDARLKVQTERLKANPLMPDFAAGLKEGEMKEIIRAVALMLSAFVSHDYNGREAQSRDHHKVDDCDWVVDVSCTGSVSCVSIECSWLGNFEFFYGNTSGKPGHFSQSDAGVPYVYASLPGLIQQLRLKSATVDCNFKHIAHFLKRGGF